MNFIDCTVTGSDGNLAIDAPGGFLIAVPAASRVMLQKYRGQAVTLGIRPEDIRESQPGIRSTPRSTPSSRWSSRSATRFSSTSRSARIRWSRVPPTSRLRMHEQVRLSLDPERLHFFDARTEQAIE